MHPPINQYLFWNTASLFFYPILAYISNGILQLDTMLALAAYWHLSYFWFAEIKYPVALS